jgi:uncharacterized membrane protein YgcG
MAAPPTAAAGLARLYSLYRSVLRAHRAALPPPLRVLGDSYASAEVRRHLKGATTPAQWAEFESQWAAYVSMLSGRADADEASGAVPALHDASGPALSREQAEQLRQLQEAALELGGGGGKGGGGERGGGGGSNGDGGGGGHSH